ncbi:hypothetical protein [Kibdelosporangium philippinense]
MINRRLPHVATGPSYTSPQVTTRMAAAVLATLTVGNTHGKIDKTTSKIN